MIKKGRFVVSVPIWCTIFSPSSTPRWPTFPIIDTPRLAFRQTLEFEGGTPTAALEAQSCGGWTLMGKPKSTPNEKSSGEWREWLGATGIHIPWKYSQPSIRLWHIFTTFWGLSWIIFSISLGHVPTWGFLSMSHIASLLLVVGIPCNLLSDIWPLLIWEDKHATPFSLGRSWGA